MILLWLLELFVSYKNYATWSAVRTWKEATLNRVLSQNVLVLQCNSKMLMSLLVFCYYDNALSDVCYQSNIKKGICLLTNPTNNVFLFAYFHFVAYGHIIPKLENAFFIDLNNEKKL